MIAYVALLALLAIASPEALARRGGHHRGHHGGYHGGHHGGQQGGAGSSSQVVTVSSADCPFPLILSLARSTTLQQILTSAQTSLPLVPNQSATCTAAVSATYTTLTRPEVALSLTDTLQSTLGGSGALQLVAGTGTSSGVVVAPAPEAPSTYIVSITSMQCTMPLTMQAVGTRTVAELIAIAKTLLPSVEGQSAACTVAVTMGYTDMTMAGTVVDGAQTIAALSPAANQLFFTVQ